MLIGYARVSTHDQNLDLQKDALTSAGCEKIFLDEISGTAIARSGLERTLETLSVSASDISSVTHPPTVASSFEGH